MYNGRLRRRRVADVQPLRPAPYINTSIWSMILSYGGILDAARCSRVNRHFRDFHAAKDTVMRLAGPVMRAVQFPHAGYRNLHSSYMVYCQEDMTQLFFALTLGDGGDSRIVHVNISAPSSELFVCCGVTAMMRRLAMTSTLVYGDAMEDHDAFGMVNADSILERVPIMAGVPLADTAFWAHGTSARGTTLHTEALQSILDEKDDVYRSGSAFLIGNSDPDVLRKLAKRFDGPVVYAVNSNTGTCSALALAANVRFRIPLL